MEIFHFYLSFFYLFFFFFGLVLWLLMPVFAPTYVSWLCSLKQQDTSVSAMTSSFVVFCLPPLSFIICFPLLVLVFLLLLLLSLFPFAFIIVVMVVIFNITMPPFLFGFIAVVVVP
uniref:Uncharacterized protein n=1 Tax=Trypanosoma vivax (strain Y486) TaxID=1055687 RepID=G0U907_TRYVY|nr:hypothetical protein TVY486_1115740 [Trypanosoma vivax Y486]